MFLTSATLIYSSSYVFITLGFPPRVYYSWVSVGYSVTCAVEQFNKFYISLVNL